MKWTRWSVPVLAGIVVASSAGLATAGQPVASGSTAKAAAPVVGKLAHNGSVSGSTAGYELVSPTWRKLTTTPRSHPFGGDEWNYNPTNLAQRGYVEEEYLVTGKARVYDTVPNSDLKVTSSRSTEYTTRAIVRRPINLSRWSGDVSVEYMNATDGFGAMIMWPRVADDIIKNRDVYVAFVGKPNAIPILREFDPARYGSLSMPNPLPPGEQTCGLMPEVPGYDPNMSKLYENGLLWDIFSGIGLSLESDSSPLGRAAKKLYAMGESQSGSALYTYYMFFGGDRTTYRGRAVYDGYLAETGRPAASPRLNQCAAALPAGDPQLVLSAMPNRKSPFFAVNSQWDTPAKPFPASRTYRLWSLAGSDHVDKNLMDGMWPIRADLARGRAAGPDAFPWQIAYGSEFELFSPQGWFCDDTTGPEVGLPQVEAQSYHLLKRWARAGVQPPIAPYLERDASQQVIVDSDGNALGGLRLPYIDAPIASYKGGFWGDCGEIHVPFTPERLQQLYGTQAGYVAAVARAAGLAVKSGYITAADAREMVADAQDRPVI